MDQDWIEGLDEREQNEIAFARLYVRQFGHGTPGHLSYTVIAKLADKLDVLDLQRSRGGRDGQESV